jgi:gliding motility-associated-like protein
VVKYDANLNQIATFPILFNVYDVLVTSGGELIVAGSTGNSSSANRTGYIQTIDVNACEPLTIICCDATICPVPNLCLTGNTIQLTAATPGGVWSGPGVSIGGIFNPAIAGVGTHTITYTLACGADSVTIIVSPCQSLEACIESNGTVTVSNGVAPYSWSYFQPASSTPITNQAQCVACGYTWFFGTCLNGIIPVTDCITPAQWITFATGNNASIPPTVTQFQVTDNASGSQLFTLSNLLPCTTCPTITVNNILQINCTCTGGSDGAITIEALGGNAPYTYLWNNGSTSSAISNLSAGQYSVTVTDADGCTGSLTVTITEPTNSPLPDVQFSFVNSTICLTDSTTGINQNIEPQTTYTWDIGYGPLLNTNTGVNIVAAQLGLGTHNITLTATGICGTANSTVTLTVIDCTIPPPVADYAVSSNNICAGDCITITNLSLADPAAAYAWLFPNGIPAIANTFDPGIICFPNAGTSDVSLSVTNPDGQQSTLVTTVTINNCTLPPPVALFTINTNPICAGDCVGFNNISTYAAGATFTWTFQGGLPATSNTLNPGLVCFTNSGTSTVKLVVTNPDGQTDSLTLTLTINNCVSTPVASFNTSNTNLCSGDCITIFNNSTASIGANYQWTFSGGNPASFNGAVPPTVCFTTSGNYVIELIITDAGGSDTANLTISVNDCNFPVALFDASSTNICIGDSILFTDQSTNATTWNWVFSGGTPANFNGSNPPYIVYNNVGSYIATLTVTDNTGHDSTFFVVINVGDCINPIASFFGTGSNICIGQCVQYTDNSLNATSWYWSFPGGIPSSSTDQNPPLICYPVAGIYPVTLIVSNTNGSDTLTINTGAIVHNPQPVNLLFSNYSLLTGDSIQLAADGGNSYQWIPATYLSSDSIPNPMASPPDTTIYTVIMTDQYGCTSSATVTVNVHPPFVVFVPNSFSPNGDGVNDQIQIYASVPLIELEFYIYDRWGTRVFTSYTYGEKWDGTFRGKPCNSGVYAYYYHARFADRSQISGHGDITLLK